MRRNSFDNYIELESDRFSQYLLAKIKKIIREELEAALEEDKTRKRKSDYERWKQLQLRSPKVSRSRSKKK